jgi:hypothetical protein
LELESHFIKGGVENKISITLEDVIPKTENLFFYPIPSDFLMKKSKNKKIYNNYIKNKIR